MRGKVGKVLGPADFNILLTGACRVLKPTGDLLCIYLPRALPAKLVKTARPVLSTIKEVSHNRGKAAGARTVRVKNTTYSKPVMSTIVGYFERFSTRMPTCRQTSWTGRHTKEFQSLYPFFRAVGRLFEQNVPDRHRVQMSFVQRTRPEWIIPGTPYSTVTVNNTYPTGVHKDAGDLREGFSCLCVLRRGQYQGGQLVFPEYRIALDLQDGDVILMDAHEWHGNTDIIKQDAAAERISCVLYFRTEITKCLTLAGEIERAKSLQPIK